jgi:plasmid maintenance system antidote protein VapI
MVSHDVEFTLEKYTNEYAEDPEFIAEGLAIKITEEMLEILDNMERNQSWLAEKMDVSRSHVSRILNARPNMTLLTIAKIAIALNVKPDVCLDTWRMNWIKPISATQTQKDDYIGAASETTFIVTEQKPGVTNIIPRLQLATA